MQDGASPTIKRGDSICIVAGVGPRGLQVQQIPLIFDVFHVSHRPSATQLPAEIPVGPVALCPTLSRGLPLSRPSQYLRSLLLQAELIIYA